MYLKNSTVSAVSGSKKSHKGVNKRQLQIGKLLIATVLIFVSVLCFFSRYASAGNNDGVNIGSGRKFCWFSYLDFQTYLMDKGEAEFEETVSAIYDRLTGYGIDTVIVQVRPMGDAIYPSEYFPVSAYISSDRTLSDYDPLQIMVDMAHEKGLYIEAWVNPYRLSRSDETTESYKQLDVYDTYSDYIYEYTNPDGETCLSLEPSSQKSIDLIVAGVQEIVDNYDVDGIHFDDYFYVDGMHDGTGGHDDAISTEEKMTYIDSMISQVYEAVKECDPGCTFGVSPAGNLTAAKSQGADIDRWLSTPGYVDYIMPQIYWTDDYVTSDGTVTMFSDMANAWQSANALNLPVYVGLALYRAGEVSETDRGWSSCSDNLAKSWQTAQMLGYDGYALFRYEMFDYDSAAKELESLKQVSSVSDADRVCYIIDGITEIALLFTAIP